MSKINLDTDEIKSELTTIGTNIETLNTVGCNLSNVTNSKYDIKSVVKFRDEIKAIKAIIERYATYGKKDINTLMGQLGVVERVDTQLSSCNKITFKR